MILQSSKSPISIDFATTASKASAARTAAAAIKQIESAAYAVPYQQPGQRVVKIGIAFARNTRTVESWKVEE